MLIDSHSHLELFEDLDEVLLRAKEAGVSKIITIGTTLETSKKAIQIAENYSTSDLKIYATCGIHPNDGAEEVENLGLDDVMEKLRKITKSSKKVVGIGECGLDYFLEGDRKTSDSEKEFQRKLFGGQIKTAGDLDLPLVMHCRHAWEEIFDQIQGTTLHRSQGRTLKPGIFHSWTGNLEAMEKALELGFYISFSGIVTFRNAKDIQEVAKKAPNERILVETDSPFLSPEPDRGMKNEPKSVKIVADFIATIRDLSPDKIKSITTRNAGEVFRI